MYNLFKSKIFLKQFLSFFMIIFISFVSISGMILTLTEGALEKQTLSVAEGYRNQVKETINRWLSGRIYNIKSQAVYMGTLNESMLGTDELTKVINKQLEWDVNYYDIILMDLQGNIINSKEGPLDINVSDRAYFINGKSGKSSVSDFFKSRKKDGEPVMAIGEPIFINNEPKYVLAGIIRLKRFKEITEDLSIGEIGHAYLVNSDGTLITDTAFIQDFVGSEHIPNIEKYKLKSSAVNNVIDKKSGTGVYKDFMDDTVIGAYEWLDCIKSGLLVEFKSSKVMAPITELTKAVLIFGIVIVILGIYLALYLSRRIVKPIEQLIHASENIVNQNYQAPLNIHTNSELDILVTQFNHMQAAIRIREELVAKTNMELRTQRAEAIQANVLKSQFLANMSHELRTPLNSIIGFTTRVLKKTESILPEIQKENLTIVKEEAYHLLELINNLLDFSKIEAGKMEIHWEQINLVKVTDELQGIIKNLNEGKDIRYEERFFNIEHIPFYTDRVKIKQILINLLSNAFKYSESGLITLEINQSSGNYEIVVEDEGVGITEENLGNIFDEFRQVDGSYTRKIGGTGLGLSITKRLVEMLGGTIRVTSTFGVGSRFIVTLPIDNWSINLELKQETQLVEQSNQIKVVCIDDDTNVHKLYGQYLDQMGYYMISFNGQEDIIDQVGQIQPDIIILDIMLPKQDGWEILTKLKDHPLTRNIPVIMASVLNERNLAYKMNADEFLVKPVSQEELLSAIDSCINIEEEIEVLIADDDENYLKLMGQILSEASLSFHLATNGVEAIESIKKRKPHVILLDIMMPYKDGFDVLEELNENKEWNDIAVIVLTAKHLSIQEKQSLNKRTNIIIEKSGMHIDQVMDIVLKQIKEKTEKR